MHKHVQRCCLLLSFLAIFTVLKAQEPLPPLLPDCEAVQLHSADNQLTISGLTTPISLVKVYDDAYNLVFECNGNCEETLIIENLNTCQTYKVEGTFFYANYEEICSFQQDILINGLTDGAMVCQGDVLLTSQAAVDAFCGCEIIEGNLIIGISPTEQSDIYSLANLSKLKTVKGSLSIVNTKVTDFEELESLIEIGQDLAIVYNALLNSFRGLDNIAAIPGDLAILDNPQLKHLDNLDNLEQVGAITISISSQLKSIKGLSKLRKVNSLYLLGLSSLESLEGVENIDSIIASSPTNSEGFALAGCPLITDLSYLQGLKYIDGQLTIAENATLADCCSISHLVDDNPDNGQVTRLITFDLNPATCNSVEAILEYCDNTSTTCADIAIITRNNDLIISGITAPNAIVKVFDNNWQLAFECNGDCEETINLSGLTAGDIYHTDIQFYDENWQAICDDRQDIEILGGDPCDDSICQGDVTLNTQAEVDAFCGCEEIEGNLIIGAAPPNNALNDIISIQNLIALKQVKGNLTIVETQLTDLEGLDNLKEINGSAAFVGNPKLISLKGLDNLRTVEDNFSILDNVQLVDLDGLESLSKVNLQLQIQGNNSLTSISALSKIKKVEWVSLISNNRLKTLDGLEGLDSIFTSPQNPVSGVLIAGNDNLVDISSLQNLKYVATDFTLSTNDALEDCCSITHLMDEDLTNGQILGAINIGDNPAFCSSVEEILAKCNAIPPVSCDNIQITTGNNDLIIEGITAPNSIVKVFDANWQLAFECNGDCEETISLSDLAVGDVYHTDIQFYDANWQAICDDRQDIEILGGAPCNDSICQGDVLLTTQAEVDAFCGCETIEGRLLIGLLIPNGVSDITSIANLHQLKNIKGNFSVVSTQLTSLEGLDNLVQSDGGIGLVANSQLTALKGLNNLKSVKNLTLLDNPVLEHLDDLESLVEVNGQLGVNTNNKLTSIKGLSKITSATVVNIIGNESLPNLEGLENIATITSSSIQNGGLTVAGNSSLEDISSLQGIKLVEGQFNLSGNVILEDCCSIAHLIDEDDTNGQVLGDVTITVNPAFCSSKEEILAKCGGTPPFSCDNIDIAYANNELKITGLTAPRAIVKVFDEDWQQIFDCFNDCEATIILPNLSGNTFHIRIANYDEDWKFLCHGDQDITVAGSRNINELLPEDFTLSPNPAYEETTIDLNRLQGETVDLKMYNQFGQEVFERHIEKVGTSSEKIDLSTIANGFYLLKIQAKGKRPIAKKLMVSRLY